MTILNYGIAHFFSQCENKMSDYDLYN